VSSTRGTLQDKIKSVIENGNLAKLFKFSQTLSLIYFRFFENFDMVDKLVLEFFEQFLFQNFSNLETSSFQVSNILFQKEI
jgi:hypothetical protein